MATRYLGALLLALVTLASGLASAPYLDVWAQAAFVGLAAVLAFLAAAPLKKGGHRRRFSVEGC